LGEGRALEQVVTQKKAALKAPGLVRRNAADVDPRVLAELFRIPRPVEGAPSRATVTLANGDVAVVVSTAVQDGDWVAATAAERAQQSQRLREAWAGAEFTAYRADLEKRIKVEILKPPETDPAAAE
ncbi:MAG: SurA N-terminal domain-containing protein, partial [Nevskiaceae bacterium]